VLVNKGHHVGGRWGRGVGIEGVVYGNGGVGGGFVGDSHKLIHTNAIKCKLVPLQ
jgi:hypothetical protein